MGEGALEVELCPGAGCVPITRERLQPGQWLEFPRPAIHVEHTIILPAELGAGYGRLVPYD